MTQKTDRLVTIFGGGGFIGRYVSQQLLRAGMRVRVAERDPKRAWFVKPLGALGQTQFIAADIRRPASLAAAVAEADAVINLVGILKGDFQSVHVEGAAHVAEAAAAAGAETLVHLSAIGADAQSPSAYGRSKAAGEAAVRAAFPNATIIRPSIVFGPEDNFVNRFAGLARMMPILPILAPDAKMQPVFVADLARAIAAAALDSQAHGGQTYELAGPQAMTMAELNHAILALTERSEKLTVEVPDSVGGAMARFAGWLPGAPITMDQWRMLSVPNVPSGAHPGFEAFGVQPVPLAAVAERWLTPFRRGGRFAVTSPY